MINVGYVAEIKVYFNEKYFISVNSFPAIDEISRQLWDDASRQRRVFTAICTLGVLR